MARRTEQYLTSLIHELIKFDTETEWVEFKTNNCEPQLIGEYISALSNSAKLWERPDRPPSQRFPPQSVR